MPSLALKLKQMANYSSIGHVNDNSYMRDRGDSGKLLLVGQSNR